MSEDLVNQLTLNLLISKTQLQKLNKKLKENTESKRMSDKDFYGERIQKLFANLLVGQPPEDLLQDVNTGFDFFMDKAIYYLKARDNHELLEKERCEQEQEQEVVIQDDIDFDKEERDIANGNYKENEGSGEEYFKEEAEDLDDDALDDDALDDDALDDDALDDDALDDDALEETNVYNKKYSQPSDEFDKKKNNYNIDVNKKYTKNNTSVGVDDIQKLPLDWFQNVRRSYKKNNIVPRRKDTTI